MRHARLTSGLAVVLTLLACRTPTAEESEAYNLVRLGDAPLPMQLRVDTVVDHAFVHRYIDGGSLNIQEHTYALSVLGHDSIAGSAQPRPGGIVFQESGVVVLSPGGKYLQPADGGGRPFEETDTELRVTLPLKPGGVAAVFAKGQ